MTDYRSVLERDLARVGPAPFGFDDVARRRERRQRNRRIAAGAVAIALIALVFGGWLGAITFDRSVPAIEPRPPLPSTPDDWTRIRFPSRGAEISSITAGGPGLVAVGSTEGGAAIWTSTDGRTWERVPQEFFNAFSDVTAGGPGLVAVGTQPDYGPEGPEIGAEAQVWTSPDGLNWTQAPPDPDFRGAWLQAVVDGGSGLVAVGRNPDGPQAWFSVDGVAWEIASVPALPAGVAPLSGDHGWAFTDVAASNGRFVAVGQTEFSTDGNTYRAESFVWTSDDGISWDEVPGAPIEANVGEERVTAGPGGFVAIGTFGVWTSDDGERWQQAPPQQDLIFVEPQDGFEVRLTSVGGGSDGYVLVGREFQCLDNPTEGFLGGSGCRFPQVALSTSPDGATWSRVPPDPRFETWGTGGRVEDGFVTTWGSRFVVAANHSGGVTLWISGTPERSTP